MMMRNKEEDRVYANIVEILLATFGFNTNS